MWVCRNCWHKSNTVKILEEVSSILEVDIGRDGEILHAKPVEEVLHTSIMEYKCTECDNYGTYIKQVFQWEDDFNEKN